MAEKIDHKFDEKYLEHRYCDLKAILEAVIGEIPYEELEENYVFTQMECEFNYLADLLGFEDINEFFDRLLKNIDADDSEGRAANLR